MLYTFRNSVPYSSRDLCGSVTVLIDLLTNWVASVLACTSCRVACVRRRVSDAGDEYDASPSLLLEGHSIPSTFVRQILTKISFSNKK